MSTVLDVKIDAVKRTLAELEAAAENAAADWQAAIKARDDADAGRVIKINDLRAHLADLTAAADAYKEADAIRAENASLRAQIQAQTPVEVEPALRV